MCFSIAAKHTQIVEIPTEIPSFVLPTVNPIIVLLFLYSMI